MARMVQIADFIKELQEIERKFGNTCVYIRDVSWGANALNRHADDERAEEHAETHCHGCDMPRELCVCNVT